MLQKKNDDLIKSEESKYWLAFSRIKGLGTVSLSNIRSYFGDMRTAWEASPADFSAVDNLRLPVEQLFERKKRIDLQQMIDELEQKEISVICFFEKCYPVLLKKIDSPPPVLYLKGSLKLPETAVAVVGSRRCTAYGRKIAGKISAKLARRGITVISGLARGIDTCAHNGAVCEEGSTVAVLGSGVDYIYPPENKEIYHQLVQQGLIISEFTPGEQPKSENFPRRNRIISGLSLGTIVIEAAARSGSLITANFARKQSRDIFAVPGNIDRPTSSGCNKLIKKGAHPLTSVEDVLQQLFVHRKKNNYREQTDETAASSKKESPQSSAPNAARGFINLSEAEQKVVEKLQLEGELHINQLCQLCSLEVKKMNTILLQLQLKGIVSETPEKKYVFKGLQNILKPI